MLGRPHRDRLLEELNSIRAELILEVSRLKPEEFDWAPVAGMKTYRQLLLEIGTMEKLCTALISTGASLPYGNSLESC